MPKAAALSQRPQATPYLITRLPILLQLSQEMDEHLDMLASQIPRIKFWRQGQSSQARSRTLLPLDASGEFSYTLKEKAITEYVKRRYSFVGQLAVEK